MALMGRRRATLTNAVFTLVLVTGAVGLGIVAADERSVQIDVTDGARATLSDELLEALNDAERKGVDLSLAAFTAPPQDDAAWLQNRAMGDFLRAVRDASTAARTRLVDFDRERNVALTFGVDRYGAVVVEGRGRRVELGPRDMFLARGRGADRRVEFVGEPAIAGAVRRLMRDHDARVGLVQGHAEREVDPRAERPLVRFGQVLRHQGVALEPLQLAGRSEVPAGLDAVLVLAPRAPMPDPEQAALERYVASGGAVGWFVEPGSPAVALLDAWGVSVGPGIVRDVVSYFPHEDRPLLTHGAHAITEALRAGGLSTVVAGATPVRASQGVSLLHTGPGGSVWVGGVQAGEPGVVPVAVALDATGGRRVIVGDVDLLGDELLDNGPGNVTFAVNAVRWLVGSDDDLSRVGRPVRERPVAMGEGQRRTMTGALVAWPLFVLTVGAIVLVGRARRR